MDSWSDERLGELSGRVDSGFKEVRAEINRRFDEFSRTTKEQFDKVDRKIDLSSDLGRREFGRLNDRLDKLFYGVGFVGLTIGLNILADKV